MTDPELFSAQLANAEDDRLVALEEAECASEDRDGYRRELARVRARVRELEAVLRTERNERAETRRRSWLASCHPRSAYAVLACVFFVARFVEENPITQIGFAVATFLLAVAFVLSPRSTR